MEMMRRSSGVCGDGTGSCPTRGRVPKCLAFSTIWATCRVAGGAAIRYRGPVVPRSLFALIVVALLPLGGCMQTTLSPSTDASMTARDRQLLAHAPYAKADVPE